MVSTFLTETTSKRPRTAKPKIIEESPQLQEQPQMMSKWEKLLERIAFSPLKDKNDIKDDYYTDLPLKPGFSFYKVLASANFQTNRLPVPIPESLVAVDGFQTLLYYDEKAGCMKKIMDKTISEYEAQLLNVNRQMLAGFEEKLFLEKLDVTKNMDLPFSCAKLLGDKDWQTINVYYYL